MCRFYLFDLIFKSKELLLFAWNYFISPLLRYLIDNGRFTERKYKASEVKYTLAITYRMQFPDIGPFSTKPYN